MEVSNTWGKHEEEARGETRDFHVDTGQKVPITFPSTSLVPVSDRVKERR